MEQAELAPFLLKEASHSVTGFFFYSSISVHHTTIPETSYRSQQRGLKKGIRELWVSTTIHRRLQESGCLGE